MQLHIDHIYTQRHNMQLHIKCFSIDKINCICNVPTRLGKHQAKQNVNDTETNERWTLTSSRISEQAKRQAKNKTSNETTSKTSSAKDLQVKQGNAYGWKTCIHCIFQGTVCLHIRPMCGGG